MLCDSHWKQHQQQRIRNCTPAWKPLQRSFFPEVNQNKACFIGFLSTASVAILLVVHFSVGIDHLLNKPNSLPSVTAERLWMQASVKLLLLLHVHLLREERTGDGVWPHTSRQHWPWQKKDRCPQSSVWSRGKIKERFWILLCFQAMKRCLSCSKQVIMSQFILQGGETGCSLTIVQVNKNCWVLHGTARTYDTCGISVISELSVVSVFFMSACTLKGRLAVVQSHVALAEGDHFSRWETGTRFPHLARSLEEGVQLQLCNRKESCLKRNGC